MGTTCKLLIFKYPLRATTWTTRATHKGCAVIWSLCIYWPLCYFLVERDDVSFGYRPYTYVYKFTSHEWRILQPIGSTIFNVIPNLVIIVTACMILALAKRVATNARKGLKWKGIMTVLMTAAVYGIAFLPVSVYRMFAAFVEKDPLKPGPFKITY